MLDYGYRSKCCYAPIKMGFNRVKNTKIKKPVWVCVKCGTRDVYIVPKHEAQSQQEDTTELNVVD